MPRSKQSLQTFVGTEDDLGPEVILNLKTLDVYRYHQKNVYYYLDLLQMMRDRYSWARILSNPTEEGMEAQSKAQDNLFDVHVNPNFNELK